MVLIVSCSAAFAFALSLLFLSTNTHPERMAANPNAPAYFSDFFIMIVHLSGQISIMPVQTDKLHEKI